MACAGHEPGHCRLPAPEGHRRPAVPRHRHACAFHARLQQRGGSAGGQRRRADALEGRRVHAHARRLACDPGLQPRSHGGAGRRHRDHAFAQPARKRRLQVQPAQWRPRGHRHHLGGRSRGQCLSCGGPQGREAPAARPGAARPDHAPPRLPQHLRRRPRAGARHGCDPRRGDRPGCRPAGRRGRALLAGHRRALQARAAQCAEPGGRPHLPLHVARLGRPHPHGPVVARRHAPADRPAGALRHCLCLRHRP